MPAGNGGSRILVWEGHWQGVWGSEVPSGAQGRSPGGGLRMLRHEAKNTYGEKKTRPYRLTSYDNIIIIIISSTRRFLFPATFALKYKTQSAGCRASEMVHNGSRA